MSDENTEHVRRTDEGASVSVKISRGTGTRDQEEWRVKGKGEDAYQAIAELRVQLEEVVGELDERPMAEQVREFDPEGEGDES